jgi:hypothetical protein
MLYRQRFSLLTCRYMRHPTSTGLMTYLHIHMASIPLGTAGTMLVCPLRGARHGHPPETEIDHSHCHPNLATYETKDLLNLLRSCLIVREDVVCFSSRFTKVSRVFQLFRAEVRTSAARAFPF